MRRIWKDEMYDRKDTILGKSVNLYEGLDHGVQLFQAGHRTHQESMQIIQRL